MRFYCLPENVKGDRVYIKDAQAHHIVKVMRLQKGDKVVVFDGRGREYEGFIEQALAKEVVVKIENRREAEQEQSLKITLAQAIPKKDKMDYIVEKCTELGVHRIIPLETDRTIVRLDEQARINRRARWQKLAIEAAKQCGRRTITAIEEVRRFPDVLGLIKDYGLALMPCLAGETVELRKALAGFNAERIIVFIGPEGDFTPHEISGAKQRGACLVSLGPRVLKSDTAAISITAILNYECTSDLCHKNTRL